MPKATAIQKAYDPQAFREQGHAIVDMLADYLKSCQDNTTVVNNFQSPADLLDYWSDYDVRKEGPVQFFKDFLDRSVKVQHPQFAGHQVTAAAPITALASMVAAVSSNGSAIYEMGASGSAIENLVIGILNKRLGWSEGASGILTSGGTLANLTALLAARRAKAPTDVWDKGATNKLGILVSAQAHYCVDRAARVMGLGAHGVLKVPVDKEYRMDISSLAQVYKQATQDGIHVIAVIGSAPSTATGKYDDLQAIARFAQMHELWFHVDAAHGGGAIFSEKYKPILSGVDQADSVVIDGHKMLMTPSIMTFLCFKNKWDSYRTFDQEASYLLESTAEEPWYDYAKRT